jgi:glycosyltransferase involved in cell wall biosynthesis
MSQSTLTYLKLGANLLRRKGIQGILNPLKAYREILAINTYKKTMLMLESLDFSSADFLRNKQVIDEFSNMKNVNVDSVNWFVPNFAHAFGGIFTILRFANYFHVNKGITNRFILYGNPKTTVPEIKQKIKEQFPMLGSQEVIILRDYDTNCLPYADISIATFWDSAYLLLKFNKTKGKFYFIQDYEPLFYPAGTYFGLAEATYRFGFYGIANSPGINEMYKQKGGLITEYFMPSVDKTVFYPTHRELSKPSEANPFTIFFYARPKTPRNAFELGLAALCKVKKTYGKSVKIFTAGENWNPQDYGAQDEIVSLGILPYKKTPLLYQRCDLGVVFMLTKHPSYLPFELMACGCPVLTNYNSSTTWLLKDGENCLLTEPSITSVYEKVKLLIEDPRLQQRLITNGLNVLQKTSWDQEIEKIYKFICRN